jgi:hypothetical protein
MFDQREPEEPELAADLAAVERQLARLTPAAPRIDRDRLMFEAGRASATRPEPPGYIAGPFRSGRYFWPAATATMTAASLLFAIILFDQHQSLQLAQNNQAAIVPVQAASQPPATAAPITQPQLTSATWLSARAPQTGYLGTRFVALTRGVGAIETPLEMTSGSFAQPIEQPATRREMLNELLPAARPMNSKS